MKSKEDILSRLEDENEFHFYQSDKDSIIYPAMEEYKNQHNHSSDWVSVTDRLPEQNELWGNVFAKIKQYGLNNEVLQELKSNFTLTKIK